MKLIQPFMQSIRFRIVGLLLLCLIPPTLGEIFFIDLYTGKQLKKIAEEDLQSHAKLITQLIIRSDIEREQSTAVANQFLQAVRLTNDYIATEHGNMAMFATLFFGIIDTKTGILHYINAGHEPVFILGEGEIKYQLKSTGPAVGMMAQSNFIIQDLQINPGDILVGYTDARSPTKDFFGRKRLIDLLTKKFPAGIEILDIVKTDLINHIDGSIQFDDITMIAVYRN